MKTYSKNLLEKKIILYRIYYDKDNVDLFNFIAKLNLIRSLGYWAVNFGLYMQITYY